MVSGQRYFYIFFTFSKNPEASTSTSSNHVSSPFMRNTIKQANEIISSLLDCVIPKNIFLLANSRFPENQTSDFYIMCSLYLFTNLQERLKSINIISELSCLFLKGLPSKMLSGFRSKCKYPVSWRVSSLSMSQRPIYTTVFIENRLFLQL